MWNTFVRAVLVVATVAFFAFGIYPLKEHSIDFTPVYTGARCLTHGCNPYNTVQLSEQYGESGGTDPTMLGGRWPYVLAPVYPPSTFVLALPMTLMPFRAAQAVWFLLNAGLLLLALRMVLFSSPKSNRWLAKLLVAFFLFNSAALLHHGQPSGIAISLLIIACLLFSSGHRPWLAACLLCMSLAIKPQIGGLIAIYLLVNKVNRRYVCAAMAGAVALLLVGGVALKLNPSSKDWVADLRASIATSTTPGNINDPKLPTAEQVNLEGVTLLLSNDDKVSRYLCYAALLFGLGAWTVAFAKSHESAETNPILLAAMAIFSLLPVYHRFYDTPLLILTIPAAMIVYNKHRSLGVLIVTVTLFAATLTEKHLNAWLHREWLQRHFPSLGPAIMDNRVLYLLVFREQILAMIVLFCLYLAAIFPSSFNPSYNPSNEMAKG
jgi:hypothetical protein